MQFSIFDFHGEKGSCTFEGNTKQGGSREGDWCKIGGSTRDRGIAPARKASEGALEPNKVEGGLSKSVSDDKLFF